MQLIIVACALLGVALGQYAAYPGYAGWSGYQGYQGYNRGYPGYSGYPGYAGLAGYPGYTGYPTGYPGYRYPQLIAPVKPVDPKEKEVVPTVIKAVEAPVLAPVLPVLEPGVVPPGVYGGPGIAIRSQIQESSPDGSYNYAYNTENGIDVAVSGGARIGPDGPEEVVVGRYSYTAPDGTPIEVNWSADKDGFHPQGYNFARIGYPYGRVFPNGLPVPVPVAAIAKREDKPVESEKKEE